MWKQYIQWKTIKNHRTVIQSKTIEKPFLCNHFLYALFSFVCCFFFLNHLLQHSISLSLGRVNFSCYMHFLLRCIALPSYCIVWFFFILSFFWRYISYYIHRMQVPTSIEMKSTYDQSFSRHQSDCTWSVYFFSTKYFVTAFFFSPRNKIYILWIQLTETISIY